MQKVVAWLLAAALTSIAAELPVRRVVLYKHGVGYFERSGELQPGEEARLEFKAEEMDDVLKSFLVQDAAGGRITAIRYDSSQPVEVRLSEFPFKLGENQPLTALLDSLKGARIEVQIGNQTIAGLIVGARRSAPEAQPEREWLTLAGDNGELRTLELAAASWLRFQDERLARLFREYLALAGGGRIRQARTLLIEADSSRRRKITAAYVAPAPVWKSSYRLNLEPGGGALLEGWAIVDNTSGEDWNGVSLSVVSGRPVSFISRLYEPKFVSRPEAQLPEDRAQGPVVYSGPIVVSSPKTAGAARELAARGLQTDASRAPVAEAAQAPAPQPPAVSSVAPDVCAREAGELFAYDFAHPVTIRNGQSAMLPFVQQKVSARKLLIYQDGRGQNPLNAVELINDTGKTLDGGPVTVYEAATYAGEALIETIKAADKRLLSYGVDLGTRVTTQFESGGSLVREVHLRRGVLTVRQAAREVRTYTIINSEQKPKTLLVEQPARPGFQLIEPKPVETTAGAYRFEVKLAAGALEKLPVVEERVFDNTYAVTNLTPDVLASYIQNKNLSPAARTQMETLSKLKRRIAELDAEITRLERRAGEITSDQARIRQNMDSLNRIAGQQAQVQEYVALLAADEAELATLRSRLAELRPQRAALESEMNSLIEKIEF